MVLAWAELRRHKARYGTLAAIMALSTVLLVMLSGLAGGLAAANIEGLKKLDADLAVLESDVNAVLARSSVDPAVVADARSVPGVTAASALGYAPVTALSRGQPLDANLFGVEGVGLPPLRRGRAVRAGADEAIVDDSLARRHEVAVGDVVELRAEGGRTVPVTVVGLTDRRQYLHLPSLFVSLEAWGRIRYGARLGANRDPGGLPISAALVRSEGSLGPARLQEALAARSHRAIEVADLATVYERSPGFREEQGSIRAQQAFLWVIALLVVALFFYVTTLQRQQHLSVLKALGASNTFLARALVAQALVVALLGGIAGGVVVGLLSLLVPASIPLDFQPGMLLATVAAVLLIAPLGTLWALRHVARVDPLAALLQS